MEVFSDSGVRASEPKFVYCGRWLLMKSPVLPFSWGWLVYLTLGWRLDSLLSREVWCLLLYSWTRDMVA